MPPLALLQPRKGQNKSGKGRFARGKMEVFRNIFYAFADNLIQRDRRRRKLTRENVKIVKVKSMNTATHKGTYHINNQHFT